MLSIDFDYSQEFSAFYNKYNTSPTGKQFLDIFGISRKKLDIASASKLYFADVEDDRVSDVNANVGRTRSPNNYLIETVKSLAKLNSLYLLFHELEKLYDIETSKKCIDGLITGSGYFHDLVSCQIPYCFSFASSNILADGKPYGQLHSKRPKRSDSFIATCTETIFDLSQEQMGALAVPDIIVNISYFYHKEGIDPVNDKHKIINDFQRLVHSLNQQFRLSAQSAFTNFSLFDRPIFNKTFQDYIFPDGTKATDITEYFMQVQEIFMEFMSHKDPTSGLPYRFPIVTLNVYVDSNNEIQDKQFLESVCRCNTEGVFNIFVCRGLAKLASCCRLLSDPLKLREYNFDSFSNGGLSLGSARVCTINFARIGRKAKKNKEKYLELLDDCLEDCRKLLKAQRSILKKRVEQGFLKFFTLNWMNMNQFFSTFGMSGLWESLQFMGLDLRTDDGLRFAEEIFKYVDIKLEEFSQEDRIPYNFEQIPAEGAASTLARLDKIYFNDENYPFTIYSNQFIPLWIGSDVVERAKIDGKLCSLMTGGAISHLNIGNKCSPKQMEALLDLAIKNNLEHFAVNPDFVRCENGHTTLGNSRLDKCPICSGEIMDHFTRVVGYFTNVNDWDLTRRKDDFPNRVFNYF